MDKEALVIEYLDLATQYTAIITSNEPIDAFEKEKIKNHIYEIREQLGMKRIILH